MTNATTINTMTNATMTNATMRELEACFERVLKAATFDDLVRMLDALADQLARVGLTDRQDIMGALDLPKMPAWGDGGGMDRHGAWSWDKHRVLYLDEKFRARVEMRMDAAAGDDDVVGDDDDEAGSDRVGIPTS